MQSTTHKVPDGCVTEEMLAARLEGRLNKEREKEISSMVHGGCSHCRGVWLNFSTKQPT